jgi:hypothetical protein
MDWLNTIKNLAPTVAAALGGPLAGEAATALVGIVGGSGIDDVRKAIEGGRLSGEQIGQLRQLELQLQDNERERGFKYAELAFKDRDSARQANVVGSTQKPLFWLSVLLLMLCLGTEVVLLVLGVPVGTSELVVGRVLGLLDAIAMTVLAYWFGTSSSSAIKTEMINEARLFK